ncbi:hypothetical protein ACTMTI_04635 [Nonomuraea sp. H19]|uniref:hypothetical protein n=1 Tax=Nonomuraea sp. H19 TaxID=3452206 RepID=UPI003F89F300
MLRKPTQALAVLIAATAAAVSLTAAPASAAQPALTSPVAPSGWVHKSDHTYKSDCERHGQWEWRYNGAIDWNCHVVHSGSARYYQLLVLYP